jgi:hypothetical protein
VALSVSEHAIAAQRAYDPGCWEWCSVDRPLICGGGSVSSSSGDSLGGGASAQTTPGRFVFGALACKCGLAAASEQVDTMRGRQTHLTCPLDHAARGGVHVASQVAGGEHRIEARPARGAAKGKGCIKGCGLAVFADEALLQAL